MMRAPDAIEDARERLTSFAEREALPGGAPRYARLARAAARNDEILALFAAAPPTQRRGTLFMAAIHRLLLDEPESHPLRRWLAGDDELDPLPAFHALCLERAEALRSLFASAKTQTNEVRRAGSIVPALGMVREQAGTPLAILEPGSAAGLILLFDRYFYDYGAGGTLGDPGAAVAIAPEVRGRLAVPVPPAMPEAPRRTGIDLAPVDVRDEEAVRWLRACVWAEHAERLQTLERAVAVARRAPPSVIQGDAPALLPGLLAGTPPEMAACVVHSNLLPYFDRRQVADFVELLRAASRTRDVYWIAVEGWTLLAPLLGLEVSARPAGSDYSMLVTLSVVRRGAIATRLLARAAPHGGWIEWLDSGDRDPT